ncbi:MAG TPA: GyrI-like domain-containing protein [Thermoanaerobaculia bacterium]|jgi:effector-binding domain-containing protein|nr:GyrI-like domain-containing protein [Thermoanaerobaculia bacterium]
MRPHVQIEVVSPRLLAAVSREVAVGRVRDVWRPALDQVWAFLRTQLGLRTDGHNIFVYHLPANDGDPIHADFGVEVTGEFARCGEVRPVRTPSGEAAVARHVGPYDDLAEAHSAIHEWSRKSGRALGRTSWEIYGDWNDDPTKLETLVMYLLC